MERRDGSAYVPSFRGVAMPALLTAHSGDTYDSDEAYESYGTYEGSGHALPLRGLERVSALATATEPWNIAKWTSPEASVSGATPGLRILMTGAVVFITTVAPGLGTSGTADILRVSGGLPGGASHVPAAVYATPVARRQEDDDTGEFATPAAATPAVTAQGQLQAIKSALGVTATELGRILGVSRVTVHTWLRGDVSVPQGRAVQRRLFELYQLAARWKRETGIGLGRLARAAVLGDGTSLVALLEEPEWDQDALERTFSVLADAVLGAESAMTRQRSAPTGTTDASPEEVAAGEQLQNRRALQRLRSLRYRG